MTFLVPARVAHRYDASRELVTLRVKPMGATLADDFLLSAGEARRLAWGLLADLCPDEVEGDLEAACDAAAALNQSTAPAGVIGCTCGHATPRLPRGKGGVILARLELGEVTAQEAAQLIARSTSIASSFIVQLVRDGLAQRVRGGMFGEPTVYAITERGRAALRGSRAAAA